MFPLLFAYVADKRCQEAVRTNEAIDEVLEQLPTVTDILTKAEGLRFAMTQRQAAQFGALGTRYRIIEGALAHAERAAQARRVALVAVCAQPPQRKRSTSVCMVQ